MFTVQIQAKFPLLHVTRKLRSFHFGLIALPREIPGGYFMTVFSKVLMHTRKVCSRQVFNVMLSLRNVPYT